MAKWLKGTSELWNFADTIPPWRESHNLVIFLCIPEEQAVLIFSLWQFFNLVAHQVGRRMTAPIISASDAKHRSCWATFRATNAEAWLQIKMDGISRWEKGQTKKVWMDKIISGSSVLISLILISSKFSARKKRRVFQLYSGKSHKRWMSQQSFLISKGSAIY